MKKLKLSSVQSLKVISHLVDCGVPLLTCFKTLSASTGKQYWDELIHFVNSGWTFSESVKAHPMPGMSERDNAIIVQLIHAGEMAGVLEITLQRAVSYFEERRHNKASNFLSVLATLLSSGVPCLQAIKALPEYNSKFTTLKYEVYESVKAGETFAQPFKRSSLFPDFVASLIDVGEQTGSLPETLHRAAEVLAVLKPKPWYYFLKFW